MTFLPADIIGLISLRSSPGDKNSNVVVNQRGDPRERHLKSWKMREQEKERQFE